MKGVITAGGLGTRLRPLTLATNKHLLPVYDQPMIYYPLQTLVRAGITEVMITVGGPHAGQFIPVLKNGENLGLTHLEFAYQEGEAGIPAAIALAEKFAAGDSICVILGDNTTDADISSAVKNFTSGSVAFLKAVPDPNRYGVPVFDPKDKNKIIRIEEKPQAPKSKFASTGLYLFDNKVFDFIRNCQPQARGELEITDVQNQYIKINELKWEMLNGFWTDAGKFETLFTANSYWAKKKGRQ